MGDDIKTIVVLGMHRSGTSMVAGILHHLGVDMGKHLVSKKPFNPRGHFENKDFLGMNLDILIIAGGQWHDPPPLKKIMAIPCDDPIERLVRGSESKLWGWKEPRTALTIDRYLPHLKNPHFIYCHRGTDDIVNSLMEREKYMQVEKLTERQARNLTRIYHERIDDFFNRNNVPRLDVDYDEVVASPKRWVKEIASFIGVEPTQEAVDFVMTPDEKKAEKRKLLNEQSKWIKREQKKI